MSQIAKNAGQGGGARALARCDLLGSAPYSDSETGLFRAYLTPAYVEAQRAVAGWMRDAGMTVTVDAAANLVGRYEGARDGPPLIIGSHLDSIRDAGRYDGPLGIMLGIECVAALHATKSHLPFPIEIYAFGDEEGSRFPAAMLTSRAVAGSLDLTMLDISDQAGVGLAEALRDYRATLDAELRMPKSSEKDAADPMGYASARHGPSLAYLECHIEQGPVLEARGYAVGTVTGIAAQKRYSCRVTGVAGHAGTNTMSLRSDALTGAAAMVLAAESAGRAGSADLVATVGKLEVLPGAANAVPGMVTFTLDVRAANDAARDAAASNILGECERIAAVRNLNFSSELLQDLPASLCSADLIALMEASTVAAGEQPFKLVSGAGHDAMVMAALCPTAMLFVRCTGGISHNPAESVTAADAETAANVLHHFIQRLAQAQDSETETIL